MAVFGPQLIYTVIMFVLLSKLGKFYSLGRRILCNKLYRYLSPGSDDLKKSVRNYYKTAIKNNKKLNRLFEIDEKKEEFNIPEGAEIELAMSPVQPYDLYYIKYADDFQSFVDISCIALFIYATTEVYIAFVKPVDEVNLSVVWCGMALAYGVITLCSIALNYIRTEEGILMYIFAGVSFMLSLIVQLADTRFFDFNLKEAFTSVTTNTLNLIRAHIEFVANGTQPESPSATEKIYVHLKHYSSNDILFTCFIALISAFIGAILFFPSFRLARLHFLCLKYSGDSKLKRAVFYLNFLMPMTVSFCWLKNSTKQEPVQVDNKTLTEPKIDNVVQQFLTAVIVNTTTNSTLSPAKQFVYNVLLADNLKVYLIIFIFLLRFILYRHYAQAYLNLAFELASSIRQTANKITNTKYITTISSIYQYYGVVASQYIIPLYCLLFLVLLLKTLGDLSWCGSSIMCNELVESVSNYTSSFKSSYSSSPSILKTFENSNFNMTLGHNVLNKIFSPFVMQSLLGYFTFWTASIWFMISCFGLMYYQYIDRQY